MTPATLTLGTTITPEPPTSRTTRGQLHPNLTAKHEETINSVFSGFERLAISVFLTDIELLHFLNSVDLNPPIARSWFSRDHQPTLGFLPPDLIKPSKVNSLPDP